MTLPAGLQQLRGCMLGVTRCQETAAPGWLPPRNTELVVSTEAGLHALLSSSKVQAVLVLAPPAPEPCLHAASMAWAYTAAALCALGSAAKRHSLSLVSQGLLGPAGSEAAAHQALALGVARTQFMEDRGSYGVTLDLGDGVTAAQFRAVMAAGRGTEYVLAVASGRLFSEHLRRHVTPAGPHPALELQLQGKTAFICGGTQGLGLRLARQLSRAGVKSLVLTSRRGKLAAQEDERFFARHGESRFMSGTLAGLPGPASCSPVCPRRGCAGLRPHP